jgi:predicted nicotinamide N-methyase
MPGPRKNSARRPDHQAFVVENTRLGHARLVPEIKLYLATAITPLWLATEAFLEQQNIAPPFWAFAWPGGEALAQYIARHPELVAGKRVLDFAAGCGLAAIAACQAGAAAVSAAEIDPVAAAAIALNTAENGVTVEILLGDMVGADCRWEVILCGDVCYEAPMTRHILPWLRSCARQAEVIVADPARKYAPADGFEVLLCTNVPVSLDLEDSEQRQVTLLRLLPAA